MNYLEIKNGESFEYSNAYFNRDANTLEFTFSHKHTHEEIFNHFSEFGDNFAEGTLDTIHLFDSEENLLGVWEGFNSLVHIQNNLQFDFALDGTKIPRHTVKVVLLKETISDEYKRVKENEINSLKEMNLTLMMALAETAEVNALDKQSTEIALAELVEILSERGVI